MNVMGGAQRPCMRMRTPVSLWTMHPQAPDLTSIAIRKKLPEQLTGRGLHSACQKPAQQLPGRGSHLQRRMKLLQRVLASSPCGGPSHCTHIRIPNLVVQALRTGLGLASAPLWTPSPHPLSHMLLPWAPSTTTRTALQRAWAAEIHQAPVWHQDISHHP